MTLSLSPGQAHDAPEGAGCSTNWSPQPEELPLLMDRACERDWGLLP